MPEQVPSPLLTTAESVIGTVSLSPLIATAGTFPQPGSGPAGNVAAMIHILPVPCAAFGASPCDGREVAIWSNQSLMALLGLTYGGSPTAFALPDLHGRVVVGGSPGLVAGQSLAMTWMIAAQGAPDAYPMTGALGLFAAGQPPAGWLAADGSRLPIRQDSVALFDAIGTTFGGDGQTWFALPDLQGRTAVGAGQGDMLSIALGQTVDAGPDTPVACLGLNYIVNTSGALAPAGGDGGFPSSASVLGEVIAFAGPAIPAGWVPASGQELPIDGNQDLFDMIGTAFGGDGETAFALPDLRGKMVAG